MNAALEFRLLNEFQHDFPLCPRPFDTLAQQLGSDEQCVMHSIGQLQAAGKISRVGAVFAPGRLGASTLAAMAVPADLLSSVAATVNRFAGVNHNYEREHHYNLWFVVTAVDAAALQNTLQAIEQAAGFPVLILPLLEAFHIDLGFPLCGQQRRHSAAHRQTLDNTPVSAADRQLIAALQEGFPLCAQPFAEIATQTERSESEVLQQLENWLSAGIIKRCGIVVRHHELGYTANAMLVHDIPDHQVSAMGHALAAEKAVTLSYRRPRRLPDWGYNLFCMIHGRERGEVEETIRQLRQRHGLENFAHEVLFSRTRFKQQGARYA